MSTNDDFGKVLAINLKCIFHVDIYRINSTLPHREHTKYYSIQNERVRHEKNVTKFLSQQTACGNANFWTFRLINLQNFSRHWFEFIPYELNNNYPIKGAISRCWYSEKYIRIRYYTFLFVCFWINKPLKVLHRINNNTDTFIFLFYLNFSFIHRLEVAFIFLYTFLHITEERFSDFF